MTDELKAFELEYRTATGKQVSEDTPQPFVDWLVSELEKARAPRPTLPLTEEEKEVLIKKLNERIDEIERRMEARIDLTNTMGRLRKALIKMFARPISPERTKKMELNKAIEIVKPYTKPAQMFVTISSDELRKALSVILAECEKRRQLPKIVCLCGSTRFKEAFDEANYQETMRGNIILSVGFFMHASGNKHGEGIGATPEQKIALDELHKRKIDLADEILVLNVDNYIGSSTRSEIEYATEHGKPITYLEAIPQEQK